MSLENELEKKPGKFREEIDSACGTLLNGVDVLDIKMLDILHRGGQIAERYPDIEDTLEGLKRIFSYLSAYRNKNNEIAYDEIFNKLPVIIQNYYLDASTELFYDMFRQQGYLDKEIDKIVDNKFIKDDIADFVHSKHKKTSLKRFTN